jgi:GNAT superfamily N-acetyltransferase
VIATDIVAPEAFLLLSIPLGGALPNDAPPIPADSDRWRAGDIARAAALLHAAYPPEIGRYFAPRGRPDEWRRYVIALVEQSPCGPVDRGATRVVRGGTDLRALALVTTVSPSAAHLAQLAVAPGCRRQGVATRLIREVMMRAGAAGREELTLLVAESNHSARRLYQSLGFEARDPHSRRALHPRP